MEIELTGKKGGIAIVSEEDYERVSKYKWYKNPEGYALSRIEGLMIRMHRFITNTSDETKIVDHINKNRLDNRRENLRVTVITPNNQNKKIFKNKKSSTYKGVFYNKKQKKYQVNIDINNKRHNLGMYDTEIKAAETFDMYLVHNKHDHIDLNFPEKRDEYNKMRYVPYEKVKSVKYIGVSNTKEGKFQGHIMHNKKAIYLGITDNPIECAKKYDKYVVKNNIPNRKLNFPEDYPDYNPNSVIKTNYEETNDENIIRLIIKSHPNINVYIDKDIYDKLKYFNWCLSSTGYITAKIGTKTKSLHRFITEVNDPLIYVDHIDKNVFNNTKQNLRISNKSKNPRNKSKKKNATSKYFGVDYYKSKNNWRASVTYNYETILIGNYCEEIYAAHAYDLYIIINLPDEHYNLNFEWTDKAIKYWKKKLLNGSTPEKWIAKSSSEKICYEIGRMVEALAQNKMLLFNKLNESFSNRMKEKNLK